MGVQQDVHLGLLIAYLLVSIAMTVVYSHAVAYQPTLFGFFLACSFNAGICLTLKVFDDTVEGRIKAKSG